MTEYDATIADALDRVFPRPSAEPDWRAIRRASHGRRRAVAATVVLAAVAVFGVLPALGVGRDTFWRESPEQKIAGYVVAAGDSPDGHWELRASQGFWLGTSAWLNGEFQSKSYGPSESLRGIDDNGPRYVGFFGGSLGRHTQFVFGAVAREVARIDLTLSDGSTTLAKIVPPPEGVGTGLRFYYAVMPNKPCIAAVIGYDAQGNELQRHDFWTHLPPYLSRC